MTDQRQVALQVSGSLAMNTILRQWLDGNEDAAVESAREVAREHGPYWIYQMCVGYGMLAHRVGARLLPPDHHDQHLVMACNPALCVVAMKALLRKLSDFAALDPANREKIDTELVRADRYILEFAAAHRATEAD